MSLHEKACLVNLKISQWTARRLDKKATADVCSANQTSEAWTRATKTLLSESATKPISRLANEARLYHYSVTLPWDDNGARLLPTAIYLDYVERMNQYKAKFDGLVSGLVSQYDSLREEARIALNGLFCADDYPSDIAYKYGLATKVKPIPQGADLRIDVSDVELQRLRSDIEADVQGQLSGAMADLWARLRKVVACAADSLGDKDKVFRDTLIHNIEDLVSILPKLNITGDAQLDALASEVQTKLTAYSPDFLRKHPDARSETAKKANAILGKMDWYMHPQTAQAVTA